MGEVEVDSAYPQFVSRDCFSVSAEQKFLIKKPRFQSMKVKKNECINLKTDRSRKENSSESAR